MSVEKLKLKRNHTWKSKPGYSICVLDRGAVRFDYPRDWKVEMSDGAVFLHDREPSFESCDLGVSVFHLPPEAIPEVPMEEMLTKSLDNGRHAYQRSEIHRIDRGDMEIMWLEERYIEKTQNRDARFRTALVRGAVVVLITMNYWSSRASGLERVWDEVLRTLQLGMYVEDPTAGPVVH